MRVRVREACACMRIHAHRCAVVRVRVHACAHMLASAEQMPNLSIA